MSLPVLASDPGLIEQAADPAGFVVLACERAKQWLAQALEHGGIDEIVELKSQAEAIRVYTAQKQIGKDAELAAAEVVRRAERGIGVAIRRGQDTGEIRTPADSGGPRADYKRVRYGRVETIHIDPEAPRADNTKRSPTSFGVTHDELSGNGAGIYRLADGVSDEQFEQAITEARAERNLTRANVVRKIKDPGPPGQSTPERAAELAAQGLSSRQIAERLGMTVEYVQKTTRKHGIEVPADAVIGRTRRHDSNRIVRETVHALEGLVLGVDLVDLAAVDPREAGNWAASLTTSLRALNRFAKQLKETTQ